ncbi:MAG: hypothetical protein EBZ69_00755 [Alphaproteobacteria bacterium]|nr:hypothetical protein [Alphaproteobacteria bacterium]
MRSSTSNKYIGLWDYDLKDYLNNGNKCTGVGGVWTLAEITAALTRSDGYFWPTRPVHQGAGPDKRAANATTCSAGFRNSAEIVDIRCGGVEALCAGAGFITGCTSSLWRHKLGFQWEFSEDKGASWFRFPGTAKNLPGEKIFIGMAAHYMGAIESPTVDPSSAILPEKALRSSSTFSSTAQYTQFYGVVDSVRISRGIARYTTPICQPYDPRASADELIDDFVIFALNIGDNPYRVPGGTVFPYYVKGRGKDDGWLVPGQAVYNAPDNDVIAPSLRNFYPHARSLNNVIYATDNNTVSPPIFSLQANPATNAPNAEADLPVLYSGGDPYFEYVWLLLHMDGTNGSTTFTDSSSNNRTVSRVDVEPPMDISISTAQSRWGGASLRCYVDYSYTYWWYTVHYLSCPLPASALTTQDWAIEAWVRPNEDAPAGSNYGAIFSTFKINYASDYAVEGLALFFVEGTIKVASNLYSFIISGGTYTANNWTHIALSYSSGVLKLYQDGTKIGETTAAFLPGGNLQIGNSTLHEYEFFRAFSGYIDDFRVTLGSDRGYTGATIPVPTEAFPDSSGPPPAPAPVITSVTDNVALNTANITNGGVTNDPAPTFNGTTAPGAISVRVSINGGAAITVAVTADAWEFTPATALADGSYTFRFKSVDSSDAESAQATFNLTIDATAPSAPTITGVTDNSLSAPASVSNGGNTYDATPTFNGTVAAGVVAAQVSVDGGTPVALTLASNAWSFTPAVALTTGSHVFSFTATDAAGNESAAATFSLTFSAPEAPAAPTNLNAVAGDEFLLLTWTAPNPNGAEITSYTVEYTPDGGTAQTASVGAGSTTYKLMGLTNDTQYSVRIAATNAVGTSVYSSSALATPIDNPPDPYFSDVVLLLHADGENNGTVFVDSSANQLAVTPNGNVKTITNISMWGSASASFDGNGDYLTISQNNLLSFGAGDFTVEMFVHFTTIPTGSEFIGFANSVVSTTAADQSKWWFGYRGNNGLVFGRHALGGYDCYTPWSPTPGVWYHIAACRVSGEMKLYIDGIEKPVTNKTVQAGINWTNDGLSIGVVATPRYLNGEIDDFRITRNVARYTTPTFEVPDAPFPDVGPLSTLPPPPTDIFLQPNPGAIFTRWKKPTTNGGAAFLGYKFKYVPFGESPVVIDLPPSATSYALTGLVNGTQYAVSLASVNSLGVGAYSTPITVTPSENPPDTYFGNVSLLAHFDGAAGSKTFVDYSLNNYTLTPIGGAEIGAAHSKWGGASLKLLRSAGSYVSVNETALTAALLTSDFTMECWFRATAAGGSSCLITTRHDGGSVGGKIFCVAASWPRATNTHLQPKIWCGAWDDNVGPNGWRAVVEGPVFDLNTWYHVAMTVTTAGQIALYVNGVRIGTETGAVLNSSRPMRELLIGRRWDNVVSNFGGDQFFDGYIDDVRITNAVRYTEAVEPVPPLAFSDYGPLSTVPTAPVDFSATAGDGRIWLSWLPPASNGGAAITGYRLEYFVGSGFPVVLTLPALTRRYIILDAINDQQYTLKIAAINAVGVGDFSPPITVTPAETTDGYFASVVLLLRMDEETFFDSSKYSSDIMRFGAEIRTDQSAFGTRSGYFAGTGSRIEVADNDAQFYFDGDYTVEAWLYIPTLNTNNGGWFFSQAENELRNANRQYAFGVNSNGLRVYWTTNGSTDTYANFNATIPTNEWVHIAFCRVGSVLRAFVNGVQAGTDVAHAQVYFNSTASVCIGSFGRYRENIDFVGYISELRVTKNVARYVANFTKPGAPFPDRGPSSAAPQAPTHLSLSSAAEKIFVSWRKPADSGGLAISGYAVAYRALTGPDADVAIVFNTNSTKTSHTIELPGADPLHAYTVSVAAVNKAGTGAASAASTITPGVKWTLAGPTVPVDLEFNKVSLLLHFEGANDSTTFLDSADNRVPVVTGTTIKTAQKASGTSSGYFENNPLTYANARNFGFGTGEFTIEMYARANLWTNYGNVNYYGRTYAGNGNAIVTFGNKITWRLRAGVSEYWSNTPATSLTIGNESYAWIAPETTATPPANTWVHVAMTRVGNRLRIYIDGAKKFDQDIGPVNFDAQLPLVVGSDFYGYIDELRITRGFARYASGDFTPISLPFADRQLNVAAPNRVAKVKAQGKNTAIAVSWQRPFDEDGRAGSRTTGYKIQYKTLDGTEVEIDTNSTLTTYTITGLTNYTQYQIRVAAYNEIDDGPWSFYIPCTPLPDEFDYIDVHKYLTYTNPDEGYLGKCGIQFPNVPSTDTSGNLAHPPAIAQAIVLHDATIPPRAENKRVIYVDCATTGAEKPPLIAAADGNFYGKNKVFDGFTAAVDKRVLVKDQSDSYLNGVYTVKFSTSSAVAWERLSNTTNTDIENYFGTRVVVLNGKKNVGTVWNCINEDVPTINQTPLEFQRDVLLGLRQEDFCVEAYFKAYRFMQPPLDTKSLNMTLIDTYYRGDSKDTSSNQFSGIRVYFSAVLSGKQGYVHVDVGDYAQKVDETAPVINEKTGPALRSKLLSTNVFYHVAVTRADDTFRLYIDGELQDQFVSQDATYEPLNLTRETNHIRYRVRPYFGLNDYGGLGNEVLSRNRHVSQYGRFNVTQSEFFFKREAVGFPYSERFNGSALMVEVGRGAQDDILNLPAEAGASATWPGKPIPNYPADAHVYIFRDFDRSVSSQGFDMYFAVAPGLRFPPETTEVDLATVPANSQYQPGINDCGSGCPPIPNSGNIQLYGIFAQGAQAKGSAAFIFSSSGEFTIPRNMVLRANGVDFNPRSNYKVVEKDANTALAPTEGNVVLMLSSASPVSILNTLRLQTTAEAGSAVASYTFAPKQTYNAVFKAIEVPLQSNELRIVPHTESGKYKVVVPVIGVGTLFNSAIVEANSPFTFNTSSPNPAPPLSVISAFSESAFTSELRIAAQNPDYVVTVPVISTTRTVLGNLGSNTQFTNDITGFVPASRDDALIQAYSLGSFSGGADDADTALTIDGVPVSPGTRVLVKNQQNARENGIYVVSTTAWTRAADMDQTSEIIGENRTRRTFVKSGYLNSNVAFLLDIPTSVPDAAVSLGFTDLPFVKDTASDGSANEFIVYVQQSFAVVPVTNASDWQSMKDSVTVGETLALKVTAVSTGNLNLYGQPSASLTDNWPLGNGATVLVRAQTRLEENGVYIVNHNGPWSRLPALSLSRQFPRELLVSPQNGASVPLKPVPGTDPPQYTPERTVAYRMRTQENFILNVHPVTFDEKEIIQKVHLPFSWGNTTKFKPSTAGGLPTSTGGKITWDDFIPDNVLSTTATSNDTVAWRVFLRCGDTIAYSRVVVLRAASKVGVFSKTAVRVDT